MEQVGGLLGKVKETTPDREQVKPSSGDTVRGHKQAVGSTSEPAARLPGKPSVEDALGL